MSNSCNDAVACGAIRRKNSNAACLSVAGWLGLVAAPTFAGMALLTAIDGGSAHLVCSAAHGASPFGGMAMMYGLMSAFHAAPWLKLISRHRRDSR